MPPEPQPPAAALAAAGDGRREAPAASRNQAALTAVLATWLPAAGRLLEVASGTGQHAAHWARCFPALTIQPSDPDADARASIASWRAHADRPNLLAPLAVDVAQPDWWRAVPAPWDAILAVNLTHISPWSASLGLLAGAAALLTPSGRLLLYGPFAEDGVLAPESNRRFDAQLRAQDPAWGVRDTADLAAAAAPLGLRLRQRVAMPANNRVLVWERTPCG